MWTVKYWDHTINSIYHMQLFIIIAPPFGYRGSSWEKKTCCKALFFFFFLKKELIMELQKFSIAKEEKADKSSQ